MTRPKRERLNLLDPSVRVTCSIRHSDYRWVVENRMQFSAILSKAIHQLALDRADPSTEAALFAQVRREKAAEQAKP